MDNTLNKIHKFGKITNILVTIFLIIACITTVITTILGLYMVQCKDASIVANGELSIKTKIDDKYLDFVFDGNLDKFELEVGNLKFKNFKLDKENDATVIACETDSNEYTLKDLGFLILFGGIACIFSCISILMLKKICKHLKDCDSFFTDDLIKKMNNFMYSLIPIFIASLFMHYYQTKMPYLSADIDFGILIDFAIIYIITTIFKYGVKLQKESDETL